LRIFYLPTGWKVVYNEMVEPVTFSFVRLP
jgi:hypothetical protein